MGQISMKTHQPPGSNLNGNLHLAGLELEGLAFELALGKLQHLLEKGEGVIGRILVEPDAVLALQIRDVPFTGITHMRPGDNFA